LFEVRIVASVEMGNEKMPKCRYIGGGAWWTLIEKELARLVPARWIGSDGKSKEDLIKRANVTAYRLTADGVDYRRAVLADTWKQWVNARSNKIEAYLRCDGIDARGNDPAPTDEADGPIEPDCFMFCGVMYRGLARKPFRALEYLWDSQNKTAAFDELGVPVWEDHKIPDEEAIRGLRRELNNFFRANAIGWHASVKTGCLSIIPGPPQSQKAPQAVKRRRR